jgi:two-component system C4-dicarboxylate transport response regulator DctD
MSAGKVIIVDDEDDVREAYGQTLALEGMEVFAFSGAREALALITPDWPGIVVSDIRMAKIDGLELLDRVREIDRELPVLLITAHGDVSMAVNAMRDGAYDFMEKPPDPLHMLEVISRALELRRLVLENRRLRLELDSPPAPVEGILGATSAMIRLRQIVSMLARADVDTLITGDTGTGKELVANALHKTGVRAGEKFVAVNCAALPESLIESELFGHEKGAFTNAHSRRIGKIEYAHKGTLFLDEIESIPLQVQVKLLRVLQERVIERIGSNETIEVDIRVIAAAKGDLAALCEAGDFRSDLFFRLNVASIEIPPLKARLDDVPLLFSAFVRQIAERRDLDPPEVSPELLSVLMRHDWPGNVRELKNWAEKYVIGLPLGDLVQTPRPEAGPEEPQGLNALVDQFEKQSISQALRIYQGRIGQTAEYLKIPRKTLYLRMQKHGLRKEQFL